MSCATRGSLFFTYGGPLGAGPVRQRRLDAEAIRADPHRRGQFLGHVIGQQLAHDLGILRSDYRLRVREGVDVRRDQLPNGGGGDVLIMELAEISQGFDTLLGRWTGSVQRVTQVCDVILAEVTVTGEFEDA